VGIPIGSFVGVDSVVGAKVKRKPLRMPAGAWKLRSEFLSRPTRQSRTYDVVAVVFVFFVFALCVFFVFVVVVVSCPPVAAANTGIAIEKAITKVNNSDKSFFILGLDLLRNYFRLE
jgi:hypothetical protein